MDPKNSPRDRVDYQETPEDLTDVHAPTQREHSDPTADVTPMPTWLTAVCGLAVATGAFYLGSFHGGFRGDVFNERMSSPDMIWKQDLTQASIKSGSDIIAAGGGETLAAAGAKVYAANCAACHQASGVGAPGLAPTLVNTEYVSSEKRMIALLHKGIQGPIVVNGVNFNGVMPPWEGVLSDKKMAQVSAYVRSSFGNKYPDISEAKFKAGRQEFKTQKVSWTAPQLLALPVDETSPESAASSAAGAPAPAAGAAPAAVASAPAAPAPVLASGATATPPAGAPPAAPAGVVTPVVASAGASPEVMALGKAQYMMICVACHQPTGLGLPPVFPPVAGSDYAVGDPKRLISIVLHGVIGPITVNGKPYNNMMPAQGPALDDAKLAAVTTFVRNSFGNKASPISPDLVKQTRAEYAARTTPWTEAELLAFGGAAAAAPTAVPAGPGAAAASPTPAEPAPPVAAPPALPAPAPASAEPAPPVAVPPAPPAPASAPAEPAPAAAPAP